MSMPFLAMLVVFPGAMAYAAASDLITMTISNRLCLFLFAAFIACATLAGLSPEQFASHFAAGALVLSRLLRHVRCRLDRRRRCQACCRHRALVRLRPARCPILPMPASCGGILTFAILLPAVRALAGNSRAGPGLRRLHSPNEGVPYGIALAFSALLVLPETAIWRAAILALMRAAITSL